jgi:hypothetical protein
MILARVAQGQQLPEAFDAVLGEGAYQRLAFELWEELRAKAA